MDEISFPRYLEAKRSVDDRALNPRVWQGMVHALRSHNAPEPLRLLELGCGTGSMLRRLLEQDLPGRAVYHAIDSEAENLACAGAYLRNFAEARGWAVSPHGHSLHLALPAGPLEVTFEHCELESFLQRASAHAEWDILLANAFLDLVNLPLTLPRLLTLVRPGGWFCFTINFDGLTVFEPALDPALDEQIISLYHRSMDERLVVGQQVGDSRSGRHLFGHLRRCGYELVEAGGSDWVVFARQGYYPQDEAYFLHFMLHFIQQSLTGCPELNAKQLASWLDARRAQIERGELVLIVHQLDFLARRPLP